MVDININTSSNPYNNRMAEWQAVRSSVRVRVNLYHRMSREQQLDWRSRDPLMESMARWAERFTTGKDAEE